VVEIEECEGPAGDLDDEQRGYAEAEGGVLAHCVCVLFGCFMRCRSGVLVIPVVAGWSK